MSCKLWLDNAGVFECANGYVPVIAETSVSVKQTDYFSCLFSLI